MSESHEVNNTHAIAANDLKIENLKLRNTMNAYEKSMYELEASREEYQEKYFDENNKVADLEVNQQQLHDLLLVVEGQIEEIEDIYKLLQKTVTGTSSNDILSSNISQLRSLVEIA